MAILTGAWQRALDDDLNIVPDAQLRIYDVGTTTLATDIFADAALTTPLSNPVPVADASGWFPLIFALSGNQYDIRLENADDSLIREFTDQEAIGSDASGAREYDFTNSRARIAGVGGEASFEAGPPTGDDIGGNVRLGGWEGTQADAAEIDAAATNFTGSVTVQGKKLIGIVQTPAETFTAASTVDIELTEAPAGVIAWDIEIWDLVMSATANLWARFSYDDGATYKAGASDYYGHFLTSAAASTGASADLTQARMELVSNFLGSATRGGRGLIRVITNEASAFTRLTSRFDGVTHSPALTMAFANWFGEGGYGRATHLRLLGASGTLTGKYRVTPLYGFGE